MKSLLFRFHQENLNWLVFFENGEILQASQIYMLATHSETHEKVEDGRTRYYVRCVYMREEWKGTNLYLHGL